MLSKIVTLLSGNALAQLVNVVTVVWVVSAYISPEDFGRYAVLMSYVGILSVMSCLRFEVGIVSARLEVAARNLAGLSLFIAASFTLIVFLVAAAARSLWSDAFLFGAPLWLLCGVLLTKAFGQVFASLMYRHEDYGRYSAIKLAQALILLVGFLRAGRSGSGVLGLMIAMLLSYGAFVVLAVIATKRYALPGGVTPRRMVAVAHRQKDFAMFNTPQVIIDTSLTNGVNIALIALAGPTIAGYYSFMQRTLRAPLGLVFGAISQVVFRFVSKNAAAVDFVRRELLRISALSLLLVAAAAVVLVAVYWFFDDLTWLSNWRGLREYIPAISVWMLVPFLFAPMATLPVVYGRQKSFFVYATSYNLLSLLALIMLVAGGFLKLAFFALGVVSVFYFATLWAWVFGLTRNDTRI